MNDYFDNISGFELLKEGKQRKITSHYTGFKELDVVTYGFPTGTITDLFGPNSSGKSQILFQTAVNTSIKITKFFLLIHLETSVLKELFN